MILPLFGVITVLPLLGAGWPLGGGGGGTIPLGGEGGITSPLGGFGMSLGIVGASFCISGLVEGRLS